LRSARELPSLFGAAPAFVNAMRNGLRYNSPASMKRLPHLATLLLTAIAVVSVTASVTLCADIAKIPWTESNIESLLKER
jgi:hypothetical protein